MAEELRLFLRSALYAGAIAVVYWFVSYDVAGTVFLVSVALGGAGLVAAFAVFASSDEVRPPQPGPALVRWFGFRDTDPAHAHPLEVDEGRIAHASPWPLVAALASVLGAVGLVFGAWFWGPGLILGLGSAWGWATQLTPRR